MSSFFRSERFRDVRRLRQRGYVFGRFHNAQDRYS